jgi:hypothetical protein
VRIEPAPGGIARESGVKRCPDERRTPHLIGAGETGSAIFRKLYRVEILISFGFMELRNFYFSRVPSRLLGSLGLFFARDESAATHSRIGCAIDNSFSGDFITELLECKR